MATFGRGEDVVGDVDAAKDNNKEEAKFEFIRPYGRFSTRHKIFPPYKRVCQAFLHDMIPFRKYKSDR